ncbi:unnamed protein product [Trifolium pratense]|uniref:Uncharacterized protein n=1 Tax=Trifolium pratense TaxID=57577 RepID=A0ACB0JWV2_TRIPR|nr:unnamed protein product [Trifolium pratense]
MFTMQQRVSNLNPNAKPFYPQNRNSSHYQFHNNLVTMPSTQSTAKVPKSTKNTSRHRRSHIPFPNTVEEAEAFNITTLMIRNIPNQFRFEDLLHILDEHCFEINKTVDDPKEWSKFDFVYLPMDFRKHAVERKISNLGYAFVNFTTPAAAFMFYREFQGFAWNVTVNGKICKINAAQHQGKATLVRIFSHKIFRCKSRKFLPMIFYKGRDGLNRRMTGTPLGIHLRGLPFTPK